MIDPTELYEVVEDLPDLGRPVLVEAMTGVVDAGGAVRLASEHLLTTLDHRLVVTFDIDLLLDYRSRRPTMMFFEDHWESYEDPVLGLYAVRRRGRHAVPAAHRPRAGPAVEAVRRPRRVDLLDRLGVRLTVGLNSIPMAVPHTRPCGVTAHATRKDLVAGYEPWLRRVQVPGSAGHLLEYELGRAGRDAMGFAAHVPHYLAQSRLPGRDRGAADLGLQGHRADAAAGRAARGRGGGAATRSTARSPRAVRRPPSSKRSRSSTTPTAAVWSGRTCVASELGGPADRRRAGRGARTLPGRAGHRRRAGRHLIVVAAR